MDWCAAARGIALPSVCVKLGHIKKKKKKKKSVFILRRLLSLKVENCRQCYAECNCSCFMSLNRRQHCKSHETPTTFLLHSCIQRGLQRGKRMPRCQRHLVVICPIVPSCGVGLFLCRFTFLLQQCCARNVCLQHYRREFAKSSKRIKSSVT